MKAIVIGGSKGIGLAISEKLLLEKHTVIVMSRKPPRVPEIWRKLDLAGGEPQIQSAIDWAISALEGLDWLILSGGMGAYLGPTELTLERLERMYRTNVIGPILVYRFALRALLRSESARVLFIGSTVSRKPGATGLSAYAGSKAALEGFVTSEAKSCARHGIAMNLLSPGWVETPMTEDLKPSKRESILKAIPVRRMGRADEVADFAYSILTASGFLAGSVLEMSGGA